MFLLKVIFLILLCIPSAYLAGVLAGKLLEDLKMQDNRDPMQELREQSKGYAMQKEKARIRNARKKRFKVIK